jgi:hypothetical protein
LVALAALSALVGAFKVLVIVLGTVTVGSFGGP